MFFFINHEFFIFRYTFEFILLLSSLKVDETTIYYYEFYHIEFKDHLYYSIRFNIVALVLVPIVLFCNKILFILSLSMTSSFKISILFSTIPLTRYLLNY